MKMRRSAKKELHEHRGLTSRTRTWVPPLRVGPDLAQGWGRETAVEEVLLSTAMVMAIWGGGRLFLLVRRHR